MNSLASPSVVFLRTELRKRISCRHQKDEVYLWNPFTVQYFVYDQSPWAACESQFPWIFKWHFYQAYQNNTLWYFKVLQGHLWAILKFISVKQSTFLVSNKQCLWLVSVTKLEKNWKCRVLKQRRLTTPATCDRKPNTFAICSFLASCSSTLLCSPHTAEQATGIFVMWDDSSLNWSTRPKHWLWEHDHLPSLRWCATEINRIAHFVNQTCLMNWDFYLYVTHFIGESFQGQQIMKSWDFKLSVITCKKKKKL